MSNPRHATPRPHAIPQTLHARPEKTFTISQLAREFGVTPRALRFYEDKDMLHPARDGTMRVYSMRDRARLLLILRGKRIGLTLNDIREILDLYDLGDGQRAQMRKSLEKFRRQVGELEEQKNDIETALGELHKAISWVEGRLERLAHEGPEGDQVRAYEAVARAQLGADDNG